MSIAQERFCRLCLKATKNEFMEINEITKEMLDILLFKVDLDITRDPIICLNCVETAKNCLNFKCTYIDTEEIILLFSISRKETKHDIKVIYNDTQHVDTVTNGDLDICRFCMAPSKKNKFASLNHLMKDTVFKVLSVYMPEVDFDIIVNPFICSTCRESREIYFKFVQKCVYIENKIKAYYREEGADNGDKIKLGNIIHFLFKDDIEEYVYCEADKGLIKYEESNIKDKISYENLLERSFNRYGGSFPQESEKETIPEQETVKQNDKINSNSKRYKCSFCAVETNYIDYLRRHTLTHTDVLETKKFRCPSGSRKNTLKYMDISEVKMHQCLLCSYKTKQKDHLTRHMDIHKDVSDVEIFKCSLCPYKAILEASLNKHIARLHRNFNQR